MSVTEKLSIVLCGWHFKYKELYDALIKEVVQIKEEQIYGDIRIYILSHKRIDEINFKLLNYFKENNILVIFKKNEGWDWGGFQQFLLWQDSAEKISDHYLFLQDDIIIKSHGFISEFRTIISRKNVKVVGNSSPVQKREEVFNSFPEDVLWALNKGFDIITKEWSVIRGSCFFCDKDIAENILMKMPIKKGDNILLANSSLRIFGAMVENQYGNKSIQYLSKSHRKSKYIIEEYRGGKERDINKKKINFIHARTRISSFLGWGNQLLKNRQVPRNEFQGCVRLRYSNGSINKPGFFNIDLLNSDSDSNNIIENTSFFGFKVQEVVLEDFSQKNSKLVTESTIKYLYTILEIGGQFIVNLETVNEELALFVRNIATNFFSDYAISRGKYKFNRVPKRLIYIK
nr:hypothetical protein [uncultured Desulfobacter sp.]